MRVMKRQFYLRIARNTNWARNWIVHDVPRINFGSEEVLERERVVCR